ncbi:hypothetical protein GCM10027055_19020 [Janibacter alkaliphilus]|uniref:histidine kinase n=1 Tax=Janibacter alkaliphilus TaxID=1069963 RepID=A0A852WYG4_9MICO|nr:signal transduction histidine kinase [Janibacter alkaliphilus]
MTGLRQVLRRLVVGVAVVAAGLAVLGHVLVLRLAGRSEGDGAVVLAAAVAAAALAAGLGLAAAEVVLRRHERGMQRLRSQVDALGDGPQAGAGEPVGLQEIDEANQQLAERAAAVARRQASAQEAVRDGSHQLRTPLTALQMRLEEIVDTDDLAVARDEAGIAMAQVERLTGVVDTLLARSKDGDAALPEISLDSVLAGLQREYQPAFTAARRSMRVEGERGLLVRAAPADLAQVMQTLVENALEHGAGTVTVDVSRRGLAVLVEVRDEGTGIPAAIAPHIFERSVTSRGSGIGLALARQIALRNGGRLELVQARPAIFSVFLAGPRSR